MPTSFVFIPFSSQLCYCSLSKFPPPLSLSLSQTSHSLSSNSLQELHHNQLTLLLLSFIFQSHIQQSRSSDLDSTSHSTRSICCEVASKSLRLILSDWGRLIGGCLEFYTKLLQRNWLRAFGCS